MDRKSKSLKRKMVDGVSMTENQEVVYRALKRAGRPQSPEEISKKLKREGISKFRKAVWRTLNGSLKEKGLIRKTNDDRRVQVRDAYGNIVEEYNKSQGKYYLPGSKNDPNRIPANGSKRKKKEKS